ncbi:MAG: hypothetical protein ACRESZ_07235 [Methylococcales bacterium]
MAIRRDSIVFGQFFYAGGYARASHDYTGRPKVCLILKFNDNT